LHFDIISCWIPSYVGIIRYTKVYLLTKIPTFFARITNFCIPATDYFVNVRTVIHNKWQSRWNLYLITN